MPLAPTRVVATVRALRAPSVVGLINDAERTKVSGDVRPEALVAANDRGLVAGSLPLDHVLLQLRRTPQAESALVAYIDTLTDPKSENFHQWLTVAQLRQQYAPAESDITAVTDWLTSRGLRVGGVDNTGMVVDFSGTAEQVRKAFHTQIHRLSVEGEEHIANVSDPEIPTALAGVISGLASLNDFRPHALHSPRTKSHVIAHHSEAWSNAGVQPSYTSSTAGQYLVTPGDLVVIYRIDKLFRGNITGQRQSIGLIEDTNVYASSDIDKFRSTFGLSAYGGTFSQNHPGTTAGTSCTDPGVNADDGEAELDAEYAGAAAPAAAIIIESCANTGTTFGGLIALQNLISTYSAASSPNIISISYGESESYNGATQNRAYYNAYQSAAALGISVFVSSGDEGAASSNANGNYANRGITVSGFASTPYNVAVGGTDYGDAAAGTASQYWSTANAPTAPNSGGPTSVPGYTNLPYTSALSYIPEIPWNDSCASVLIANALGYSTTYGSNGFCNSTEASNNGYLTTGSGSGGPSNCATGTPATSGVANGSCAGWPKPSWQSVSGNPIDAVRDIPDVSLFAANGVWGHYFPYCYTDPTSGRYGAPCTGTLETWSGAGGTSFSAPILAAIQALINQSTNTKWGNPNPQYYSLGKAQYAVQNNPSCQAQGGINCPFHDVTTGDMDVNCRALGNVLYNCFRPSGTYGVLSTSNTIYQPAYGTTTGWDFATGLGSVNATVLVDAFLQTVNQHRCSSNTSTGACSN